MKQQRRRTRSRHDQRRQCPKAQWLPEHRGRLVAHRGTLFVRDLARPGSAREILQLGDMYASRESPSARALFEASLGAALTLQEIRAIVVSLGHDPNTVAMTSDRHWTWSARKS